MKKTFFYFLLAGLLFFANCLALAIVPPPRLIVRADDMASSRAANIACVETALNGITTSIEVMVVCPWFPETVKILNDNPTIDVGLHLVLTSEWDNMKWRPLTHCPSLTDSNDYFLPMMWPNKNYPGLSIMEAKWSLKEIEQEFRAQIELALKNIPQIGHISGHMGSLSFAPEVSELVAKLCEEYNLTTVDRKESMNQHQVEFVGYTGSNKTYEDKEKSFLATLDKLEGGKTYIFIDHPALDNEEMQTVGHIGYEWVAKDRQGVTGLFTSDKVKNRIKEKGIQLVTYNEVTKALPRSTPAAEKFSSKNIQNYLADVKKQGQDLHSLMILRHGKVIYEEWLGDNAANKPHILNSVSKTFTATAIGFAVQEKLLTVNDEVILYFKDYLSAEISPNLKALKIKDLLTMSVGHDKDPTGEIRKETEPGSWERLFLATPIVHQPGTKFVYNSLATYMLAAIIQKVSGETLLDYLYPRLFRPLGIVGAKWDMSPSGVNTGGWGLFIKTEDLAKMGQFMLQKGKWNGKQLLSEAWFDEATTSKIQQAPAWAAEGTKVKESDWIQGYGYQIWRCRHNAYRADGANGQFIIVLPEKDAVIVTTADINDMQAEINLIWKHLLKGFK
ncbi:ChbG/HpnK family deacetylase [Massilibacteroides sp.]|uniref:ChbG/HpnK family deacetylase n=1 Tax=Massilibacteroides sp. TaxID=2034766 RepID=UPI00262E1007|nr:ChbG/HpnK family deacetylase [Massilibacteroides sp.]MDD4516401.1 ChbG/HpnK family deacetylase [Massilibacteroides sp.]